ncbi:MAG TPA: class I SAM-dependent methyltransferase [Terriglobales bacterium]|nr:class I SAM-dependent methyltransferase [Terriglobales bacterium]
MFQNDRTADHVFQSRAVPQGRNLEDDPEVMVHQQIARLKFFEQEAGWNGCSVLDFGCGSGFNSQLLGSAASYLGFDAFADVVHLASRLYPSHRFRRADGCDPGLDLGRFERVICCEVLEHVPDMETFVRNIARHLEPGGKAFITTPNVQVFSNGHRPSPVNREHIHELDLAEFRALLAPFGEVAVYGQRFRRPELAVAWREEVAGKIALLEHGRRWVAPPPPPEWQRRLRSIPPVRLAWSVYRDRILAPQRHQRARRARPYSWRDFEISAQLDDALWFCAICSTPAA